MAVAKDKAERRPSASPAGNGAAAPQELPKEQQIAAYRDMLLIRRFEEKAGQLYGMGLIGGFCHLYIGQEAVAVGTISALRADDYLISAYREHGQALADQGELQRAIAVLERIGQEVQSQGPHQKHPLARKGAQRDAGTSHTSRLPRLRLCPQRRSRTRLRRIRGSPDAQR